MRRRRLRIVTSSDFDGAFEMKVLRNIYRALTDVWMVVDADGNAKVYPFLPYHTNTDKFNLNRRFSYE